MTLGSMLKLLNKWNESILFIPLANILLTKQVQ